ncbi:hypothetical protein RWE15_01315 [Virgibacillus halophilus]|uniref:Spore germination protein PB n=1 Tax=Tigheibacillus halophilus TaxID=361280 RepID=A0ABU5C385_9BACI|nr:hypothetical protein [Virgibacillus halophilus]
MSIKLCVMKISVTVVIQETFIIDQAITGNTHITPGSPLLNKTKKAGEKSPPPPAFLDY